jgi:hypothetical protein
MSNHKWQNDECVRCGLKREKREYKKAGLPYSVLGRDGCWYDKVPYTFGTGYWYGETYKFERPDCPVELPNPEVCDATEAASSNADSNTKQIEP